MQSHHRVSRLASVILVVAGLATAQSVAQTNLSAISLSIGTGELITFDTNGVILRVQDGAGSKILPRVPFSKLTDNDVQMLLRVPKFYSAVTGFAGVTSSTMAASKVKDFLEKQWTQKGSLTERVRWRIELLELMKSYNAAAATYSYNLAQSQLHGKQCEAATTQHATLSAKYRDLRRDNGYQGNLQTAYASKAVQEARARKDSECTLYEQHKAQLPIWKPRFEATAKNLQAVGFELRNEPPFDVLPSIIAAEQIDAARKPE